MVSVNIRPSRLYLVLAVSQYPAIAVILFVTLPWSAATVFAVPLLWLTVRAVRVSIESRDGDLLVRNPFRTVTVHRSEVARFVVGGRVGAWGVVRMPNERVVAELADGSTVVLEATIGFRGSAADAAAGGAARARSSLEVLQAWLVVDAV